MKDSLSASNVLSYEEKLASARVALRGNGYAVAVHKLVPTYSKHIIRNVVNGKTVNELVLAALLIVVARNAKKAVSERLRLQKIAEKEGLLG